MERCFNDILQWDGVHIGTFDKSIILNEWKEKNKQYWILRIFHNGQPGYIVCSRIGETSLFPLIVEDIKSIFGMQRQGAYRIRIERKKYIIFYAAVTADGQLIQEPTLSEIDIKSPLRSDPSLTHEIRKSFMFCDLLALQWTTESAIILRPVDASYIPIVVNTKATTLNKETGKTSLMLSKLLYNRWFGENIEPLAVIADMIALPDIKSNDISEFLADIRKQIDDIVKKYDDSYIWYSSCILDRITRYLYAQESPPH